MGLVDSHCHLDYPDFDADREAVIARAHASGISTLLTIATRKEGWDGIRSLTETHRNVWGSVGIHPTDVTEDVLPHLAQELMERSAHPKIIGFGETGIDLYHAQDTLDIQEASFQAHVDASRMTGLPLIIHTRDSEAETETFLVRTQKDNPIPAVMHCFTGSLPFAKRLLDLGFYISLSGIVTFKNAHTVHDLAREIPLDRLLVETDAPFLAPNPHRGKRNEPSFVAHTAQAIADLRGIPLADLIQATSRNFFSLFQKATPCASAS